MQLGWWAQLTGRRRVTTSSRQRISSAQRCKQFGQDQYHGFLAYAYFDLASAQRAQGAIYEGQARSASDVQQSQAYTEQALAAYTSALENYQQCSAQKSLTDGGVDYGVHSMQNKIACFCEGYEILVGKRIGDLGGAAG